MSTRNIKIILIIMTWELSLRIAIWKIQENQVGPKLNMTHQPLAYADDVKILRDNIDHIHMNT
jgi:hypothetical protein